MNVAFGFVLFVTPVFPLSPFHYMVQRSPPVVCVVLWVNLTFYEDMLVVGT